MTPAASPSAPTDPPDRHCPAAGRPRGERRPDETEHGGLQQGSAHPLRGPRGQEDGPVASRAADRAGEPEGDHGEDEQPLRSDPVGQAPADNEESREEDRVRADDPLGETRLEAQLAGDARQRDVDDRVVERDEELGHGQHRQDGGGCGLPPYGHRLML